MSIFDLMEVLDVDNWNETELFKHRKIFKTQSIVVKALESTGEIQIIIDLFDSNGKCIHVEGKDSTVDLQSYIEVFDFVLKLLLHTDSSEAILKIEPSATFPDDLSLVHLPSIDKAQDVLKLKELQWGFGAPFELYVQIEACNTTVHKLNDPNVTGHEALADLICMHNFEARIGTLAP